jgi:hypothetical protein
MYFLIYSIPLLGALPKLRKVAISFVISACPAVHMEHLGSHSTDFHEILFFEHFAKIRREISSFIKIRQQ